MAQSDSIGALAGEAGGKPKSHATARVRMREEMCYNLLFSVSFDCLCRVGFNVKIQIDNLGIGNRFVRGLSPCAFTSEFN